MTKRKTTHPPPNEQAPSEPLNAVESAYLAHLRAGKIAPAKIEPEQGVLPGVTVPKTPGDTSVMQNDLARTPLFSPIKRGRRKMLDKARLPSPAGNRVAFVSGKQLDMADQDTWLVGLQLAAEVGPDQPVTVVLGDYLRRLGWKSLSDRAYHWLKGSFERLSTCRVFLETDEQMISLPLLGALILDKASGTWTFTIPKETMALFLGQSYGYVDMTKRRALAKRVDLAKWLQSYAASHAPGQHSISLENLHKWSGSDSLLRVFRARLPEALDELKRVGILKSWEYTERQKIVRWTR